MQEEEDDGEEKARPCQLAAAHERTKHRNRNGYNAIEGKETRRGVIAIEEFRIKNDFCSSCRKSLIEFSIF